MASKSAQSGSRQVAGTLILIVLAVIVGVCIYATVVGTLRTNHALAGSKTKTGGSAGQGEYYVTFNELGFRIKRSPEMKDWSFVEDSDIATIRYVHSAAYDAAIDSCRRDNPGTKYPTGPADKAMASFGTGQGQFRQVIHSSESLARQFDDFYITISYPTADPCIGTNGPGVDSPTTKLKALSEALKAAQKL